MQDIIDNIERANGYTLQELLLQLKAWMQEANAELRAKIEKLESDIVLLREELEGLK